MVALDCGGAAAAPLTSQVEVVGRLATDMAFTNVLLRVTLALCPSVKCVSQVVKTYIERLW